MSVLNILSSTFFQGSKQSIVEIWIRMALILEVLLISSLSQAELIRETFFLLHPIETTEARLQFCKANGFLQVEKYVPEEDHFLLTCIKDTKILCQVDTPISELERELSGKLFFIQTLPGLSEGRLISTFQPKGVHIKESTYYENKGKYVIDSDRLSTLHFTLNNLVPWGSRYTEHPFVVLIPVHQPQDHSPITTLTSMSFTEVITLGDMKLPKNTIIMYRKKQIDASSSLKLMLKYYEERGFKVLPYDDGGRINSFRIGVDGGVGGWEPDHESTRLKKEAVKKVVLEHGGANLDIRGSYFEEEVLNSQGQNLSTLETFRKMMPHRNIAIGLDDFTRSESHGEQWRSLLIRNHTLFAGDIYSIREMQMDKLNQWFKSLGLPASTIEHQSKFSKSLLVSYRAMDLVFGHLANQNLAYQYIQDHLSIRNNNEFLERFNQEVASNSKNIEELAKEFVDYNHLKELTPGDFDLASKETILGLLVSNSMGMRPGEAHAFFEDFYQKSSVFNHTTFSINDRKWIQENVKIAYAFCFMNQPYRSKITSIEAQILKNFFHGKAEDLLTDDFLMNFASPIYFGSDFSSKPREEQLIKIKETFQTNEIELERILKEAHR